MTTQVMLAVVLTALGIGGGLIIIRLVRQHHDHRKLDRDAIAEAQRALAKALSQSAETLEQVPKLLAGLIQVSHAQVAELQNLIKASDKNALCVQKLYSSLFRGDGRHDFTEFDEKAADQEQAVLDYVRDFGVTRQEAEERVKRDQVWKSPVIG